MIYLTETHWCCSNIALQRLDQMFRCRCPLHQNDPTSTYISHIYWFTMKKQTFDNNEHDERERMREREREKMRERERERQRQTDRQTEGTRHSLVIQLYVNDRQLSVSLHSLAHIPMSSTDRTDQRSLLLTDMSINSGEDRYISWQSAAS